MLAPGDATLCKILEKSHERVFSKSNLDKQMGRPMGVSYFQKSKNFTFSSF